ncbi:MAG: hypothetical protein JOZ69_08475 [Myxococcales bacterium]|nr:hypothetical protein [Myxococcales bacterium]
MACDYLFGAVGTLPQALVLALVGVALLAAALARRSAAPGTDADAGAAGGAGSSAPRDPLPARRRFARVAAALLLAYLVSPWAIGAGAYFDARFLPPGWARRRPCFVPVRGASCSSSRGRRRERGRTPDEDAETGPRMRMPMRMRIDQSGR